MASDQINALVAFMMEQELRNQHLAEFKWHLPKRCQSKKISTRFLGVKRAPEVAFRLPPKRKRKSNYRIEKGQDKMEQVFFSKNESLNNMLQNLQGLLQSNPLETQSSKQLLDVLSNQFPPSFPTEDQEEETELIETEFLVKLKDKAHSEQKNVELPSPGFQHFEFPSNSPKSNPHADSTSCPVSKLPLATLPTLEGLPTEIRALLKIQASSSPLYLTPIPTPQVPMPQLTLSETKEDANNSPTSNSSSNLYILSIISDVLSISK